MRAVLVTGGAKRVGAAISTALAQDGWHVIIHYNSSANDALALQAGLRQQGLRASVLQADLASKSSRVQLMCDAIAVAGSLDAIVNCASRFDYDTWETADDESVARAMAVNAVAPLHLAQLYAKARSEPGCVINVLDNRVFAINPDYFSYTVSKVALHAMTQMLAQSLPSHIRVCGIAPGITMISGNQTQAEFVAAHVLNPLQQGCTPEQVASAVLFILNTPSFRSQVITIDGGEYLAPHGRDVAFVKPGQS